jgi:hypothetical protein
MAIIEGTTPSKCFLCSSVNAASTDAKRGNCTTALILTNCSEKKVDVCDVSLREPVFFIKMIVKSAKHNVAVDSKVIPDCS